MRRIALGYVAIFGISFAAARWVKPSEEGPIAYGANSSDRSWHQDGAAGLRQDALSKILSHLEGLNTSDAFIERWGQTSDQIQRRLLLARWSGVDPEGATAFLSEHGQFEALSDLMKCWVARDPRAAISHYKSERDKLGRNGPWEHELYAVALQHDPETMIDIAIEHEMHMRVNDNTMMDDAFERWASIDLNAALAKALGLPEDSRSNIYLDSPPRVNAFAGIGKSWARQNLNEALTWARGLDPRDAGPALHGIVTALAEEDPNAIIPYLEELEKPFEYSGGQVGAGSMAVIAMTKEDPVGALQWIAENVHKQDLSDVIGLVFSQEVLASNPHLISKAIAEVGDTHVQKLALMEIQGLADSQDIGSALEGALELSEGTEVRQQILGTLLEAWSKEAPARAVSHLEAQRERYGDLAEKFIDKLTTPSSEQDNATFEFGP